MELHPFDLLGHTRAPVSLWAWERVALPRMHLLLKVQVSMGNEMCVFRFLQSHDVGQSDGCADTVFSWGNERFKERQGSAWAEGNPILPWWGLGLEYQCSSQRRQQQQQLSVWPLESEQSRGKTPRKWLSYHCRECWDVRKAVHTPTNLPGFKKKK